MLSELVGKKILVVGGGGFIGSVIVRALYEHGATVKTLLGLPGQYTVNPPEEVGSVLGDIRDLATMRELAQNIDVIVHSAGPPSVMGSFQSPCEYESIHVGGTVALLQAAIQSKVRRFVYISSAEVYGVRSGTVMEDDTLEPRSPYAAAKVAAETFLRTYTLNFGLESVILRPFSIYGPKSSSTSLVGTVVRQALCEESVRVNDLRPVRDYCYVEDLGRAVVASCIYAAAGSMVFNVGTGIGTSVKDLVTTVLKLLGRQVPVVEDRSSRRVPEQEILHLTANCARARNVLGWIPEVDLTSGLRLTIASMRSA